MTFVPKEFLSMIYLDDGQYALPCKCGRPTDIESDGITVVVWQNGIVMACHDECLHTHA